MRKFQTPNYVVIHKSTEGKLTVFGPYASSTAAEEISSKIEEIMAIMSDGCVTDILPIMDVI